MTPNKKCASIEFATNKRIIIEEGNLFAQDGLKVIQVHRTFDMNDDMVSSRSVWGQLISRSKEEGFDLEKAIGIGGDRSSVPLFDRRYLNWNWVPNSLTSDR